MTNRFKLTITGECLRDRLGVPEDLNTTGIEHMADRDLYRIYFNTESDKYGYTPEGMDALELDDVSLASKS